MKLDEFNNLSDEEKTTFLSAIEGNKKTIFDLTAERDSLRTENESLNKQVSDVNKELKATKEMNFTLARKIQTPAKKDAEETLNEFMKGFH